MSIIPKCPICWGRCGPGQCETKQQPEALRLADALTTLTGTQKDKHTTAKQAAAEMRRLHTENEAKDALLRQALEALERMVSTAKTDDVPLYYRALYYRAIVALRERLGVKEQA